MVALIRTVFYFGPMLFAVGFLLPLLAQIIERTGFVPPFGLSALAAAAIVALPVGLLAQIRGQWV